MLLLTEKNNTATLAFKTGQRRTTVQFPVRQGDAVHQVREAVGALIMRTVEKYVNHRRRVISLTPSERNRHRLTQLAFIADKLRLLKESKSRGIATGILEVYPRLLQVAPGITSKYYPEDMILLQELHALCRSVANDQQFEITENHKPKTN